MAATGLIKSAANGMWHAPFAQRNTLVVQIDYEAEQGFRRTRVPHARACHTFKLDGARILI